MNGGLKLKFFFQESHKKFAQNGSLALGLSHRYSHSWAVSSLLKPKQPMLISHFIIISQICMLNTYKHVTPIYPQLSSVFPTLNQPNNVYLPVSNHFIDMHVEIWNKNSFPCPTEIKWEFFFLQNERLAIGLHCRWDYIRLYWSSSGWCSKGVCSVIEGMCCVVCVC